MSWLRRLTPVFAVVTLPIGILAALFVGWHAAAVVFVVGWLLLTPLSAILFGGPYTPAPGGDPEEIQEWMAVADRMDSDDSGSTGPDEDPIAELRDRYARGEIDEAELERRLEALLEIENLEADDEAAIERAVGRLDDGGETGTGGAGQNVERELE